LAPNPGDATNHQRNPPNEQERPPTEATLSFRET
jgi:hypothetical protein